MKKLPVNIIISRTDSIGDVVLTLPVAAVLKKYFPEIKIGFMGKAYTRPVIEACKNVDAFIDVNDFLNKKVSVCGEKPEAILHVLPVSKIAFRAKQLNIPIRIGTSRRIYHWITCNKLVKLSRKNSLLHEAQLNIKLLKLLGITKEFSFKEIGESFALERLQPLPHRFSALIQKDKYNLILHPKSQGNGREWGLDNFIRLIHLLDKDRFQIFISGIQKERESLQPVFDAVSNEVTDITGLMNLTEFMTFIAHCNGLIASGTGPLHLAAALGKDAFGIYPPIRPMHPGRWGPIGKNAKSFVIEKNCEDCRNNAMECECIKKVNPLWIKTALDNAFLHLTK